MIPESRPGECGIDLVMAAEISRLQGASIDMDAIAQNAQFLSEKTLREIAKGPLVKFTLTCQETDQVNRVWQSLLQTLSSPSLSPPHSAEAYNAGSAFIDAATNSKCEATKQLALSVELWLSIFDICLTRYEDAKPKHIKQLLGSITTILAKRHQGEPRQVIQLAIIEAIIPSIVLGEPQSCLKGSLVFLEMFIRKGAFLPSEFISSVRSWLEKNPEKWTTVFAEHREALQDQPGSSEMSDELAARIFVLGLLTQTNNRTMAASAGNLISVLIQKMKPETSAQKLSDIWVAPVRRMILQSEESLEDLSNRLLQPLFTIDPSGFRTFLETLPVQSLLRGDMSDESEAEYMLLFAALQVGKKVNLVHEDYILNASKAKINQSDLLLLKSEVIGNFLLHREANIRIAALSLLITAFSTLKPFTVGATKAILRGLPSMHAESDAYTRGEILSLTRRFILRLKGGIVKDEDVISNTESTANKTTTGQVKNESETKEFLMEYIQFLGSDLRLNASYPRHITALKALKLLLDSGLDPRTEAKPQKSEVENVWKVQVEVFDTHLLRLLIDLLMDPFEEVRQTSLSILSLCPREILLNGMDTNAQDYTVAMRLTDAVARAESLASNTSRADHADTVARLYHIIFAAALPGNSGKAATNWWSTKASVVDALLTKLEERLSSTNGLFNSGIREAPLHGYTSGLRLIVLMPNFHTLISDESGSAAWKSVHERIVSICDRIWLEAKPVLCIDSPEGHSDEPTEELNVGPKDVLSYSWRSLRESTLLLHATLVNTSYGPSGDDGLKRADFAKIGGASFTQLAELRHRGAFSNVSQTFATCCQRCSSAKDPSIRELPRSWYQEAKSTIFDSASKLTRRSAGLPALVTGIVASDPGTPFFKEALEELHRISYLPVQYDKERQYLELPQVHAMNCLKDIFTNAKLGPYTEPFIMKALTLSAERLGSPIWALRNSGLMLFRALLTKMCRAIPGAGPGFGGSSGSEPGSRIAFPKYPGLLELLSGLLTTTQGEAAEGTEIITERVFPALELVGDKVPSNDGTDEMLRDLVIAHLSSPVWGVREHAARVYASLLSRTNIPQTLRELVALPSNITENYVHGVAMCVRYALRRYAASTDAFWTSNLDGLLSTLRTVLKALFHVGKSPTVAAELVEILVETLGRAIEGHSEAMVIPFINEMYEAHDLDGILTFVFDASQSGWNLASATRSSALLRRALAWCTTMKLLVSGQTQELLVFFNGVSQFDSDAVRWITERLNEQIVTDERYQKPLADLYTSVVLGDSPPYVRTMAASNLASILEKTMASQFDDVSRLDLPWEAIANEFRPETDIETWNREATDAELRLRGCLLAIRLAFDRESASVSFEKDIHNWTVKLCSALSEETEFTTRFAAVASVGSFARALRPSGAKPRVDPVLLNTYLVLYDMLNDDDEELRDMSASTASWVLSHSFVSPDADVTLAPLNASALLAQFIVASYSDSTLLGQQVLLYLTGQQPRLSASDNKTRLAPVANLLAEYRQESTVLFVEEKQNLFIDEIREAEVWSQGLTHLQQSAFQRTSLQQISIWASEGLTYMASLLKEKDGQDGLMGWVSTPEAFTLGYRVIAIASALTSPDFSGPQGMVDPKEITHSLVLLLTAGRAASVHGDWLSRIQRSLPNIS